MIDMIYYLSHYTWRVNAGRQRAARRPSYTILIAEKQSSGQLFQRQVINNYRIGTRSV